jgi:methylated-DNA-protein-cysteine methyltransferase-like protein
MATSFRQQVIEIIRSIPEGKVATYGQIATFAGNPRAARQVVRVLHSCSDSDNLPWHRVINRHGQISLKPDTGYEIQKGLLEREGIEFDENDTVDLDRFLWSPL